jgi:hypothetical protein
MNGCVRLPCREPEASDSNLYRASTANGRAGASRRFVISIAPPGPETYATWHAERPTPGRIRMAGVSGADNSCVASRWRSETLQRVERAQGDISMSTQTKSVTLWQRVRCPSFRPCIRRGPGGCASTTHMSAPQRPRPHGKPTTAPKATTTGGRMPAAKLRNQPGNSITAPGSAFNPDGVSGKVYSETSQYDVACARSHSH